MNGVLARKSLKKQKKEKGFSIPYPSPCKEHSVFRIRKMVEEKKMIFLKCALVPIEKGYTRNRKKEKDTSFLHCKWRFCELILICFSFFFFFKVLI